MTSKAIAKVSTESIAEIENALVECSSASLAGLSPITRTLRLADGMEVLRRNLSGELLTNIKALANTELGFLTDRPPGGEKSYADWQLRDAVIEGMLRGASIIGNEINIIAGRCYLTKAFFERTLREWPGLANLKLLPGVPASGTNGCLVPYQAEWTLNGVPDSLNCDHTSSGDFRIPVKLNTGMGADAIIGKATRKILARIHARVSGSTWAIEAAESEPVQILEVTANDSQTADV